MSSITDTSRRTAWHVTLLAVASITAIRIAVLIASPLQLYPDEAQYWWWAQSLDLGYFSKPPLIAWIIWATTHLFGNSEWAIRLGSPLLHAATALMLFAIGCRVRNSALGMWSALAWLTLPGVAYSSGLISTDVPLLFCWAVALYALLRLTEHGGWRWYLLCGAAIGFGMLAKYAMLYFVIGTLIGCVIAPRLRHRVFSLEGLTALVTAMAVFSPNLYWNWAHHFPTVHHTASNADWRQAHYSLENVASFAGGQLGVFGPIMMIGFLTALVTRLRNGPQQEANVILAALAVPTLVLMAVQAYIAEANANWAATAYVSATPLAVSALMEAPWALAVSFAIDGVAMAALWVMMLWPAVADHMGVGNAFKRQEGWQELGRAVVEAAQAGSYDAIAVANRSVIAELTYYAQRRGAPLRAWDRSRVVSDHFEMTMRLSKRDGRHVLLVLLPAEEGFVLPTFESAKRAGELDTPIGGHHRRKVVFFDARGYSGPLAAD